MASKVTMMRPLGGGTGFFSLALALVLGAVIVVGLIALLR